MNNLLKLYGEDTLKKELNRRKEEFNTRLLEEIPTTEIIEALEELKIKEEMMNNSKYNMRLIRDISIFIQVDLGNEIKYQNIDFNNIKKIEIIKLDDKREIKKEKWWLTYEELTITIGVLINTYDNKVLNIGKYTRILRMGTFNYSFESLDISTTRVMRILGYEYDLFSYEWKQGGSL